jgi:hypothetical protein
LASDGQYTVEVTCRDLQGFYTRNTETFSFTLDTSVPAPVIEHPEQDGEFDEPVIVVNGTSELDSVVEVYVESGDMPSTVQSQVVEDGRFSMSVVLAPGSNRVVAVARDEAGNENASSVVVRYESPGPDADISVVPAGGSVRDFVNATARFDQRGGPQLDIDRSSIHMERDGVAVAGSVVRDEAASTLVFTPDVALPKATYRLIVIARDTTGAAGSTREGVFNIDPYAPEIMILVPERASFKTNDPDQMFEGTIRPQPDSASIVIGEDTQDLTVMDGIFTHAVTLGDDGTYRYLIVAEALDVEAQTPQQMITLDRDAPGIADISIGGVPISP